ncbi:FHA domain-containing protein [Anatilimnocola sp. NA78]|uniref:FHA domain-containing protein n=1 Tax=Anatilimnocola sp. NA78 TaxID=3415683 RepID=UPI003CE47769
MKLRLISQDPLASPREIVLEHFPADIGRGVDVSLRIDDRWISRRHCQLNVEGNELLVRDLGSRHGTYVNGQPIDQARLLPGNELCLGLSHFLVDLLPEEALVSAGHDSGELDLPMPGNSRRVMAMAY